MAEKRTPTITVKTKKAADERKYLLPTGAHLMVQNGHEVYPGDIVAKIPRATTKTKDITGGLPRVMELFEARHPRDKAVISGSMEPCITVRFITMTTRASTFVSPPDHQSARSTAFHGIYQEYPN